MSLSKSIYLSRIQEIQTRLDKNRASFKTFQPEAPREEISYLGRIEELNFEIAELRHQKFLHQQQFERVFEHCLIGVAIVGKEGHFVRVNRAWSQITGYSKEELEGAMTWQEITHPDDIAEDTENVEMVLDGTQEWYQMTKRYRHKKGHWIAIKLRVVPIKDELKEPLFFISQVKEVDDATFG